MKYPAIVLAILTVAFGGSAQTYLPIVGAISDLKSFTKVYVDADSADARKLILKEFKKAKRLEVVSDPSDAQFIIQYKAGPEVPSNIGLKIPTRTSEMRTYFYRDLKQVVAWSKTQSDAGVSRLNETNLTKAFLKALEFH
jgi:hypothetical protein